MIGFEVWVRAAGSVLTPGPLLWAVAGAFIGTALGILPGLGPTVVLSLLLVPSTELPTLSGLTLLVSTYFGTQYGDSLSAVLMNVPSEPVAIVIAKDGYALARRGRAGAVLAMAACAAFCGAIIGLGGLVVFESLVTKIVFLLGPVEITALAILAFVLLSRIMASKASLSLVGIGIGLMLGTIGLDPQTGSPRLTFGLTLLDQGITLIPVILGLVGLADVFERISRKSGEQSSRVMVKIGDMRPTGEEIRRSLRSSGRSGILGFVLGLIPGPALTIASFAAYRLERWLGRNTDKQFGEGEIEGVTGPKAADDAAVSASLASLITLGIPFTPVTGVLFAGFLLHGVVPGPLLIRNDPALFCELVLAMLIANVALVILNIPLARLWVLLLRVPPSILSSGIVAFVLIGAFSLRNSAFDMLVAVGAGVLGLILKRLGVPPVMVVIALILGPIMETNFRESMALSGGSLSVFLQHGISLALFIIIGVILLWKAGGIVVAQASRIATGGVREVRGDPARQAETCPPDAGLWGALRKAGRRSAQR